MSKARDLATLASTATTTATQSYVTTAINSNNTSYVDAQIINVTVEDMMDGK